jgi:hypothetical protein
MSQTEDTYSDHIPDEPKLISDFLGYQPPMSLKPSNTDLWLRMFLQHIMQDLLQVTALILVQQMLGRAHVIRACFPHWSYPLENANTPLRGFAFPLPPFASWLDCWDIGTSIREAQPGDTILVPVAEMKAVVQERLQSSNKTNILLVVQAPMDVSIQFVSGQFAGSSGLLTHVWGGRAYVHVNDGKNTGWVALYDIRVRP